MLFSPYLMAVMAIFGTIMSDGTNIIENRPPRWL